MDLRRGSRRPDQRVLTHDCPGLFRQAGALTESRPMIEPTRVLYITCSNGHRTRRIAKIVQRTDFESIFTEPRATKGMRLIWVNTPETVNLRDPSEMPSGTTDDDRKAIFMCFMPDCRHAVAAQEGTVRRLVYEPATRRGQMSMDISELERKINDIRD